MELQQILAKLQQQEEKINKIYASVESTRKYFLWTTILTIAFFVIPLALSVLIIPKFISSYTKGFNVDNLTNNINSLQPELSK